MNVEDLIAKLLLIENKKIPVLLDSPRPQHGRFFILKGIEAVEEVEIDKGEKVILLTPYDYSEDEFLN